MAVANDALFTLFFAMETPETNIVQLHPMPAKCSKWWDRKQTHKTGIDSYYEVENSNRFGVTLVLHHILYRQGPHWVPLVRFQSIYEAREEMETYESAEDAWRKSRVNS